MATTDNTEDHALGKELNASILSDISSRMRWEDVQAITLRVMNLADEEVNHIENEKTRDVERNYEIFIKWRGKVGAEYQDLQNLMLTAVTRGIPVGRDIFQILGTNHPGGQSASNDASTKVSMVSAIAEGKDLCNAFPAIYEAARQRTIGNASLKELTGRARSLDLLLANGTDHTLKFDAEYFDSGKWCWQPDPMHIKPGCISMMFVSNRVGAIMCGVTGAVRYKLSDTNKYLFVAFNNPSVGCYKNYIIVTETCHDPKWAYDQSVNGDIKDLTCDGFHVTATMRPGRVSPQQMIQYTISHE